VPTLSPRLRWVKGSLTIRGCAKWVPTIVVHSRSAIFAAVPSTAPVTIEPFKSKYQPKAGEDIKEGEKSEYTRNGV